jgi:hypothetical protein
MGVHYACWGDIVCVHVYGCESVYEFVYVHECVSECGCVSVSMGVHYACWGDIVCVHVYG